MILLDTDTLSLLLTGNRPVLSRFGARKAILRSV